MMMPDEEIDVPADTCSAGGNGIKDINPLSMSRMPMDTNMPCFILTGAKGRTNNRSITNRTKKPIKTVRRNATITVFPGKADSRRKINAPIAMT